MSDTLTHADLRAELASAERRAAALRKLMEAAEQLNVIVYIAPNGNGSGNGNGTATEPTERVADEPVREGPRGRAAVRAVVRDKPTKTWTISALARELLRRGWTASTDIERVQHALGESLRRMVIDGEAIRVRPGVYKFTDGQGVMR